MDSTLPEDFVRFLLPHLVSAGKYSRVIQTGVQAHAAKPGDTAFQQALTDADLSVQSFLEVMLLSRFPNVSFYSEEHEQSLNVKYFPRNTEFEVLVDPIDGTRAYLDGAESYQIIVSLRDRKSLAAVLIYMPRKELCYVAIRNKGAVVYTADNIESGVAPGEAISLSATTRRVLAFHVPDLQKRLGNDFEVVDILEEYKSRHIHRGFMEFLNGSAAACIHPHPQLIDAGAIGFVGMEAGGTLTDWTGRRLGFDGPADQRLPGLVVSASKEFHQEILQRLAETRS